MFPKLLESNVRFALEMCFDVRDSMFVTIFPVCGSDEHRESVAQYKTGRTNRRSVEGSAFKLG